MADGINAIGNLPGKVDANGALLVSIVGGGGGPTDTVLLADGSVLTPALSWKNETDVGWYRRVPGNETWVDGGTAYYNRSATGLTLNATSVLGWSSAGAELAPDTMLVRISPNLLAMRNGTVPQTFRVYGNASTSSYVQLRPSGTTSYIETEASGQLRVLVGTYGLIIDGSGQYVGPSNNNWMDLGRETSAWRVVRGYTFRAIAVPFASLPTGGLLVAGMFAYVTDSTVDTWGSTIAGGGSLKVLAFYNGTAWTVAGK